MASYCLSFWADWGDSESQFHKQTADHLGSLQTCVGENLGECCYKGKNNLPNSRGEIGSI